MSNEYVEAIPTASPSASGAYYPEGWTPPKRRWWTRARQWVGDWRDDRDTRQAIRDYDRRMR